MTERDTENAGKLVTSARVFAANSRDGFAEQYPTLKQLSVEAWDALVTVAGSGTALLMIPARYDAIEQKQLTASVVTSLHEWDQTTVESLADFINFVASKNDVPERIPELIGSWALRNLKLDAAEDSAAQVLGLMLVKTFGPWWEQ